MRRILHACPNLQHLSFRLTNVSGSPESVRAWELGIESHADFVNRLPGWFSKIVLDDFCNSTGLYCFVPTEFEGEGEQEGGEGVVVDSPLGSLAPLYEDLILNDISFSNWECKRRNSGQKRRT